ncbi:MAG: 50S ribosomal protein L1 [Phycisphaerales bacterium JB064]
MGRMSKRTAANAKVADAMSKAPALPVDQAITALKKFKGPRFDQTVEVCLHLNLDTKQADQALRGSVALPKGIGQTKRVVAFCSEDKVKACLEAGAIKAGGEDLVAEIEGGFFDFDVAVASPDMMRVISKLGRVLGPKGLMPSPKAGTVTTDVPTAVKEYAAGKLEYRADSGGNIHAVIGKMSFPEGDLQENYEYFVQAIEKIRPSAVKGEYIKKITISGTMTPGVRVHHEAAVVS